MPNYASQLGEAVGNAVESEIHRLIQEIVKPYGLFADTGGSRPQKRKGEKLLMVNDTGIEYQIDLVVENSAGDPLILVESKYIRYTKHNRDKASWTCVAHYKLRTTYPSIRKSIAVLMGNWSAPSKKLMNSFGVEIIEIPFSEIVKILGDYDIEFEWDEKDNATPRESAIKWSKLADKERVEIGKRILAPHAIKISEMIIEGIESENVPIESVEVIELLVKTSQRLFLLKKFSTVRETVDYLLGLMKEIDNVKGKLG